MRVFTRLIGLLMLLWTSDLPAQNDLLRDLRLNIGDVFAKDSVCQLFEKRLKNVDVTGKPVLQGYKGAVLMAKGRHAFSPLSKLSYFNEGKGMLEKSIAADQDNVELRFLRLTIQVNVPAILGYSSNKAEDLSFVQQTIPKLKDEELRDRMTKFIKLAKEQGKL